ncbi:adenylate/guanylate cyclase domain-containing protein [Antrihabitans cavernicola]|uniref:HAMP domain-containing protein n=1 Tax=Antrihabitans cavernicola TaxID=2495913 RepID=A0A5A7SBV0_9NOCA|nr:adenylate/guanylate cyclase domain-containing protein [Spelaeibacter cavernicola]KAA0022809.1 HAMP domain-containing protein [Spelaeibacter cavernicola]
MSRLRAHHPRTVAPLGSWLLGTPNESIRRQRIRVQLLLMALIGVTNLVGAMVVTALITVVIPGPNLLAQEYAFVDFVVAPLYTIVAVVIGMAIGTGIGLRGLRWAAEGREPTRREQVAALAMPARFTMLQAVLWAIGVAVFTAALGTINQDAIPKVAFTIGFAGVTTCAFCYVLSEFALRPVAARALEYGDPRHIRITGVTGRSMLAWILGSGVPVFGLMTVALFSFVNPVTANQLAVSILGIGILTIVFGLLLTRLGSRATVDPIRSVTNAMSVVERGDTDAYVVVYDGTELGELQSGFNRMAEGLQERERIRELFGRHVGREVADAALARNPELGGEECTVAVFFIDIISSTQLAASHPPQVVVDLLNRFFDVVVEEVDNFDGIINKFEGDAALAIFGAPLDLPDAAGQALATARAIRNRLPVEVSDCRAAIGIAYGVAVAGNIGARKRFEYTVIGDPVNEAARLCELAKTVPSLVLASDRAVGAAREDEAKHWRLDDSVTLRGRSQPTRLASPVD